MPAAPPKNNTEKIEQNQIDIKKSSRGKTFALVKRLLASYVHPYMGTMFLAIFFMAIASAMTAAIAALMQPVLDDVLYGGNESMIVPVAVTLSLVFAVRGITTYFHTILMNKVGQSIVADIQTHLFSHFMRMEMAFFHANPSGQLISRVVNDVTVVRGSVTGTLTGLGKSSLTLIFLIGVMFYRDWQLTLAAFIVFPLLSAFVIYIGHRLRKVSKNIQNELGSLSDLLSQAFQGIRIVKAYGMEEHEVEKVSRRIKKVRDLNIKSVQLGNLSTPVNDVMVGMIVSSIIIYGGYAALSGQTTPGNLASFISAFILAYEPMKKLARLNNSLQMGLGAAERIFNMLDRKPVVGDKDGATAFSSKAADITFKSVDFSYDTEELKALKGIEFNAPAGGVTALVGPSGGGKSTIMNLIPRFYDVDSGAIEIGGTDINDVTQESLRAHIALVSQDITIFNDTVLENIRYGSPDATDDEVLAAAKQAAAHDFILEFEEGYHTVVGEDGVKLSGGQRQRLSIARAMLRDAPILLLDEATSALDNESEKLVQGALKKLEKGRTTLVIAHRLSTVQDADQILVLNNGVIEERGTHGELLAMENGLYRSMHRSGERG
ncbi:MAG: ABC transporter ATP-binding protein [Alphaproteobacteria bacterium]